MTVHPGSYLAKDSTVTAELLSVDVPLQVSRYILVACLTLCVWDWLLALSDELEMIRRGQRLRRYILEVVYFVVRICPIIYLVADMLISVTTLDTTIVLTRIIAATNIMMMPAACGLFFVRLRGVYWHDKYIIAFFGFCWLVVLGFFVSDSTRGLLRCSDAAQLTQCLEFHPYDAWGYIATAAYDTLMYLAISWKLASFSTGDRWQDRLKSFLTGDGLGWLSKVLLRSGQVYYFITISFLASTIYSPTIHSEWNGVFTPPNITIASIMACRLFRELKLGLFVKPMTEDTISNIVIRDIGTIPSQHSRFTFEPRTLDDAGADTGSSSKPVVWGDESRSDGDIESEDSVQNT